jgi:hypothetical protein
VPVVTEPKLRLVGLAVSAPAVTAVADNGTAKVGLGASEVTVRVPLAFPAAWGEKLRLAVVLCPAARVRGRLILLMLKPVPLTLAWLMVTVEPPELVMVTDCFLVLPTVTLPKEDAPAINEPAASPVPLRTTLSVGFDASLVIESSPLALPADWGAKLTLAPMLWPAARVSGRLRPLMLKPVPLTLAWLMVTVEPPELVIVTDCC